MISLRNRAVASGMLWAVAVTIGGSFVIGNYVDELAVSRFDEVLDARHDQVIVALVNSGGDPGSMDQQITDPLFYQPFSGYYWQAENEAGDILVSRSMTDALLEPSVTQDSSLQIETIPGPAGQLLRSASQSLTLDDGSVWQVTVGTTTLPLENDRTDLRNKLYYAFTLIGILATGGALLIVVFTLQPLTKLRNDVAARWDKDIDLPENDYPIEVLPLVQDINELLARNNDIIGRSRRQTADLAHALKTPSAILRNELEALDAGGANVRASLDALNRLDSQLNRSFARMKASQESAAEGAATDIGISLGRMGRAFTALARNKDRTLQVEITPNLTARINQSDLEEVVGNILDNALKWSVRTMKLSATQIESMVEIVIEDDGPGIAKEDHMKALSSGQRLDESKPGTGLGLAIASDLVAAYQGSLDIQRSEDLGGTKMIIRLALVQRERSRRSSIGIPVPKAVA